MGLVELELFKRHCNATEFDDDDEYMQHLLDAAEEYILQCTNRTEEELLEMGGGELPKPLKHAVLLIGGHWYNQRESVSGVQMHSVPETFQALVKPFRKLA